MSRVALIGENSIEYVEILINIWNSGDCAVLIDWRVPYDTKLEMMKEANVCKCYIEEKFAEICEFNTYDIAFESYKSSHAIPKYLSYTIYNNYVNNYSDNEAVIIYSSGTTGKSKGVVLTHRAINLNADAIIKYMEIQDDDCIYMTKTISHLSSITGEILVALKTKIKLVIAPIFVPPRIVLNNISKYRVTIICINPSLLKMYIKEFNEKKSNYNLASLKKIFVHGAKNDKCSCISAKKAFPNISIYYEYGLSEAGPRVSSQAISSYSIDSVGKPIQGVSVKIIKENGNVADLYETGIIHVKSPSVFIGYVIGNNKFPSLYKDWLNTGDVGYYDEYHELHIVDRIDNMIIKDAHKIYPSDIESIMKSIHGIDECVVVTKNDALKNVQIICLYTGEKVEEKIIRKKLIKKLMSFEVPDVFVWMNDFPYTISGKIDRNNIKNSI